MRKSFDINGGASPLIVTWEGARASTPHRGSAIMHKHLLALSMGVATLALSSGAFAADNKAYTGQQDNNNIMDITQSGSGGFVGFDSGRRVDQRGGSENSLVVRQSGTGNVVGATDYNTSQAVIDGAQNGNSNTLRIDQSGSNNGVRYRQFGNNNGSLDAGSSNGANGLGPYGGTGTQSPVGGGNNHGGAAGSIARWDYVSQSGTGNQLAINQDSLNSAGANGVISRQDSTSSRISLTQKTTSAANNYAYFNQFGGTGNSASVSQNNDGSIFNLVDVRQGDNYTGSTSSDSTLTAAQAGFALDLFVNQTGTGNRATTTQVGSQNTMSIFQFNDSGSNFLNEVTASQNGSNLYLVAAQSGAANKIVSTQTGTGHTALISQTGYYHSVDNTQSGNNQFLDVTQYGYNVNGVGNKVTSNQSDGTGFGGNRLTAKQDGYLLVVDSTQSGTQNTATVDQNGYSNQYIGLQTGTSNYASAQQGFNGNVANVLQNGTGNRAMITQNR